MSRMALSLALFAASRSAFAASMLALALATPGLALAQVAKYGETTKGGDYESYIAKDGTHYKIGEKLKIGTPQGGNQTFTYVLEKMGVLSQSTPCPARCAGLEFPIEGFRAGGKGQNFRMWAKLKTGGFWHAPVIVNFESALESGELIGRGYTSDQALAELKKWKDKLDLELITQAEYEAKKAELSKFIK
jgi:hypothetical protein